MSEQFNIEQYHKSLGMLWGALGKMDYRGADGKDVFTLVVERIAALEARLSKMEEALEKIIQWSKAYPVTVFPEPDFEKAAKVLKDNGMTLDAVSASNMRHVITEVAGMAREALAGESDDE